MADIPRVVDLSSQLDGSTKAFSLPQDHLSGTVRVSVNGVDLTPVVDFTETAIGFELTANEDAPGSDEYMVATYYRATVSVSSAPSGGAPGEVRTIALPGGGTIRLID